MNLTVPNKISRSICLLALIATGISCSDRNLISMQVELTRTVSKLPFVIAADQGLYEKYGLDVEIYLPLPEFGGVRSRSFTVAWIWRLIDYLTLRIEPLRSITGQLWKPDIRVSGANGIIVERANSAKSPHLVFLAATDCVVRAHIVARKGIERLEDLKGKRLGVSGIKSNTGFVALLLAERMGWDPIQDISIITDGNDIDALREGRVDAFVASERSYAAALQEGFPVLAATSTWGAPMAGNSVIVNAAWLEDPRNREVARRFLKATIEGIALFHQDRELVLEVLAKWHGITDRAFAETVYESGRWIPRKPYPCYEGIMKAMERYDSNEMRRWLNLQQSLAIYTPEDFYDDSLMRELDESGFIDSLYATVESKSP